MKAQVAARDAKDGEAPPRAGVEQCGAGDPPQTGQPPCDDEEDGFKEVPTVANRTSPVSSAGEQNAPVPTSTEGHIGAGTYRIVHPAISDSVAEPVVNIARKPDQRNPAKRMILGSARKPR